MHFFEALNSYAIWISDIIIFFCFFYFYIQNIYTHPLHLHIPHRSPTYSLKSHRDPNRKVYSLPINIFRGELLNFGGGGSKSLIIPSGLKGCWCPPTIGNQKVTAWITCPKDPITFWAWFHGTSILWVLEVIRHPNHPLTRRLDPNRYIQVWFISLLYSNPLNHFAAILGGFPIPLPNNTTPPFCCTRFPFKISRLVQPGFHSRGL